MSKKKILIIAIIIVISVPIFTALFSFAYVSSTNYNFFYQEGINLVPQADIIIVPGGEVSIEGPSLYIEHRLDTAIKLYRNNKASKILLSGAYEADVRLYESEIMYQYLIKQDIPSKDIIIDNHAEDTHATLHRAKEKFQNQKMIICTQEMYMDRTMFLAKQENLDIVGVSSDIVIYTSSITKSKIREFFACTKAVYDSVIHPNKAGIDRYPMKEAVS